MLTRFESLPTSVCPVPIDTIRRAASIDTLEDMDILQMYASAATSLAEQFCGRFFVQKQVKWTISTDDRTPFLYPVSGIYQAFMTYGFLINQWIHLPSEVVSIDAVTIGSWGSQGANATTTDTTLVLNTDYQIDTSSYPGRVMLLNYSAFDFTTDHISITYTAGLSPTPEAVEPQIKLGIMMLVARMKDNRGEGNENIWSSAIENILGPHKIHKYGSPSNLFQA